MEGQEWANIIVKNMREVQFTSIWKKQAWREETSVKFTGKPNVTINPILAGIFWNHIGI